MAVTWHSSIPSSFAIEEKLNIKSNRHTFTKFSFSSSVMSRFLNCIFPQAGKHHQNLSRKHERLQLWHLKQSHTILLCNRGKAENQKQHTDILWPHSSLMFRFLNCIFPKAQNDTILQKAWKTIIVTSRSLWHDLIAMYSAQKNLGGAQKWAKCKTYPMRKRDQSISQITTIECTSACPRRREQSLKWLS